MNKELLAIKSSIRDTYRLILKDTIRKPPRPGLKWDGRKHRWVTKIE